MASLLKLFLSLEPSLRFYLRSQRIAELHEALISSLLVCQPEDPLAWLISCLLEFNSLPTSAKINLDWNYFIPEILRPVNRPINIESSLSYIFAVCDDTLEPSERQIRLAVEHYQYQIRRKLFYAWLRYYLNRLGLKRWLEQREEAAKEYHRVRLLDLHFRQWAEWGRCSSSFFSSALSSLLFSSQSFGETESGHRSHSTLFGHLSVAHRRLRMESSCSTIATNARLFRTFGTRRRESAGPRLFRPRRSPR